MKNLRNPLGKTFTTLFLACLLALGSIGLSACSQNSTSENGGTDAPADKAPSQNQTTPVIKEGAAAPDFTFTTIDGKTASLSDFEGKVVLLNFWATWCGYCIDEMPALQQISENYPEDVVVLAINRGDSASKAKTFAQENTYDFVWGLDDDGAVQKLYPANGIPYSVIINKDGVIQTIFEGSAPNMYPYFEEAVISAGA